MKLNLPKIYPITDTDVSGLSHTDQVRQLIIGEAEIVQIREKKRPPAYWIDDARESIRIAQASGIKVIINDRVDIAFALGADGVHLGQDDLPPERAREILGPTAIIGYSTHTPEQASAATRSPIDYIAIGPVFATDTKIDTDPTVGVGIIIQIREIVGDLPIVAIGGITETTLRSVLDAGADSAAMINAAVGCSEDISANFARLLEIIGQHS